MLTILTCKSESLSRVASASSVEAIKAQCSNIERRQAAQMDAISQIGSRSDIVPALKNDQKSLLDSTVDKSYLCQHIFSHVSMVRSQLDGLEEFAQKFFGQAPHHRTDSSFPAINHQYSTISRRDFDQLGGTEVMLLRR